ncbi:MAG: hypothetical protein HYS98_06690 [Deltaproteobacteria bacterium]|nr:hypothetical protein [Deltaproteobacteria bacterium]
MKSISRLFLFLFCLSLISCGGGNLGNLSNRDLDKAQQDENTIIRIEELKPILGKYSGDPKINQGIYFKQEDSWQRFELNLVIHEVAHQDLDNVKTIVSPHLGGSAKIWERSFGTYREFEIETGEYDPMSLKVSLTFKNIEVSLKGAIKNNILTGEWRASLRGGSQNLIRIKKEL